MNPSLSLPIEVFQGAARIACKEGLSMEPAEKMIRIDPEGLEAFEVRLAWKSGDGARRVKAIAVPEGASGKEERSSAAVARIIKP